jgi:hypothetical protein
MVTGISCGLRESMAIARELMDWDNKIKIKITGHVMASPLCTCGGYRAGEPNAAGGCAMLKIEETGRCTVYVGEPRSAGFAVP